MVMRYGMDPSLGHVSYESVRSPFLGEGMVAPFREKRYSDDTARDIDVSVKNIVEAAFDRTVAILSRRRATLERGAQALLQKETLGEEDLKALASEARAIAAE
jgi:cell division protease FtsH